MLKYSILSRYSHFDESFYFAFSTYCFFFYILSSFYFFLASICYKIKAFLFSIAVDLPNSFAFWFRYARLAKRNSKSFSSVACFSFKILLINRYFDVFSIMSLLVVFVYISGSLTYRFRYNICSRLVYSLDSSFESILGSPSYSDS